MKPVLNVTFVLQLPKSPTLTTDVFTTIDSDPTHIAIGAAFMALILLVLSIFILIDISNLRRDIRYMKRNLSS